MMTGIVKNVKVDKRFGFVKGTDGLDRFFHESTVAPGTNFYALKEGDQVEFDHEAGPKGARATNLRLMLRG